MHISKFQVGNSPVIEGAGVVWAQSNGTIKIRDGPPGLAQINVDKPSVTEGVGVVWFDPNGTI